MENDCTTQEARISALEGQVRTLFAFLAAAPTPSVSFSQTCECIIPIKGIGVCCERCNKPMRLGVPSVHVLPTTTIKK